MVLKFIQRIKDVLIEAFLFTDIVPDVFGGIELRAVCRQQLQVDVFRPLQLFAFVPSGTVCKQQDFFFCVGFTKPLEQFIDGGCITYRSNEAVAFSAQRIHRTKAIDMLSYHLLLYYGSFPFRHPAPSCIADASKTGFIFKEDF